MQLGLDMTRILISLTMVAVVACGPESDGEEELRNELAGVYSTRVLGDQVLASATWISIYEFNSEGTGTYHRLSCLGEFSEDVAFEWSLRDRSTHATIEFDEEHSAMDGQWVLPGADCTADSTSRVEIENVGLYTLHPGRRCNPQLGIEQVDGVQTCEFEVCGGESIRCGGMGVEG
jgi:hypothetical protein